MHIRAGPLQNISKPHLPDVCVQTQTCGLNHCRSIVWTCPRDVFDHYNQPLLRHNPIVGEIHWKMPQRNQHQVILFKKASKHCGQCGKFGESMGWEFQGESIGHHFFSHEIECFPVKLSLKHPWTNPSHTAPSFPSLPSGRPTSRAALHPGRPAGRRRCTGRHLAWNPWDAWDPWDPWGWTGPGPAGLSHSKTDEFWYGLRCLSGWWARATPSWKMMEFVN